MTRWISITALMLLGLVLFLWTCGDDDDDDSGGGNSDCIICSTTSECTDALGTGWVCVGGCCENLSDEDDDDASDDDDATDDDDAADDDDDGTDEWGLTWVSITGDYFHMGCVGNDFDCQADEKPDHIVRVSDFQITQTEITQAQFFNVTGLSPSDHALCNECPVEQITWEQASTFCTIVGGRLPMEAEWEYAARGGADTIYSCGDSPSCLDDVAWFADNSQSQSHPVGQKEANGFGLYDMLGNVFEWVYDWYDFDYYASSPQDDPTGPADGDTRVLRGGAYAGDAWGLRISYRHSASPAGAFRLYGFRCAKGAVGDQESEETR